jgi:hypothetical protein
MADENLEAAPSPLESAYKLAAAGVPVFPCMHNKQPRIEGSFYKATTDAAQILAWWSQWPDALIGVRAGEHSGLWVADADIDKKTGESVGDATLSAYELDVHPYRVATPSGGVHYLFRWREGLPKMSAKRVPFFDVRTDGGYIIAWDPDAVCAAKLDPHLAFPPPSLIEALETKKSAQPIVGAHSGDRCASDSGGSQQSWAETAFHSELAKVRHAQEGTRNDTLNRSAFALGQIVGGGRLALEQVRRALIAAGMFAGLPEAEVRRTVDGALKAGIAQPRGPKQRDPGRQGSDQSGSTPPQPGPKDDVTSGAAHDPDSSAPMQPDMSLLRPARSQPPPFPGGILSAEWDEWCQAAAESKGAPPDYIAGALFSVAGSLIGNARWVRPWADWEEPPIVWVMLVGNPSAGKSPAMQAALVPLKALEKRIQKLFRMGNLPQQED